MGKYFGTDGIRGVYGKCLTERIAYLLGLALSEYFGGLCVVGRDTRVSGEILFSALKMGLEKNGASAINIGVVPTPCVSMIAKEWSAKCGVMITASHNEPQYNGLKVFAKDGIKLSEDEEIQIEKLMDSYAYKNLFNDGDILKFLKLEDEFNGHKKAKETYISQLTKVFCQREFDGLKVLLDIGNGAAGTIASEVFARLGASVISINDEGDGSKINVESGALYIENLIDKMDGFDLGFGFDGDADRVAVVVGKRILDGDSVLYSLSKGTNLKDGVVVGTLMSNSSLDKKLLNDGKKLIRTAVGDKYILDAMLKKGYSLGGEQSGHYIFYPERKTGDGILAALKICRAFKNDELEFLELLPQKTISIKADKRVFDDNKIKELIEKYSGKVESLLVRMSGTEPKIRVSVEDEDAKLVEVLLKEFVDLVEEIKSQ